MSNYTIGAPMAWEYLINQLREMGAVGLNAEAEGQGAFLVGMITCRDGKILSCHVIHFSF